MLGCIVHTHTHPGFLTSDSCISSKGYIELPTRLEDNLVFENKKDHLWHMDFDDVDQKLIITSKLNGNDIKTSCTDYSAP